MEFGDNDILTEQEVYSLFSDDGNPEPSEQTTGTQQDKNKEKQETTEEKKEEIDFENLFSETPESVGSEANNNKDKDNPSSEREKSSPYVLSSFAKSLKEEGIIDLEDDEISNIKSMEDFREVFTKAKERQVQSQLDERQKRIDEALNNDVEPNVIKNYENTLTQLNSITKEILESENPQAEGLRKNLIRQDYLNKGFSPEKAERAAARSIADGTDVDDAKEALQSIKNTVILQYNKVREDAKNKEDAYKESMKSQAATLRKEILDDKSVFGELELDKATRQKVLDNLVKTVYTDPDTGETYTAIQKFEKDNKIDFLKKISVIFTLTDGFKTLDGLVKSKVKKEVGAGLKNLEQTLNNTSRNSDGSLNFMSGTNDDNSFFKDYTLDV